MSIKRQNESTERLTTPENNADAATATISRPETDASEIEIESESETGRTCDDCGAHVTHDYHRVFSDNEGRLNGCIQCEGHGVPRGGSR